MANAVREGRLEQTASFLALSQGLIRGRYVGETHVIRPIVDEFVMMRFAELVRDRTASAAAERAISAHRGNGGCVALESARSRLTEHLAALEGMD